MIFCGSHTPYAYFLSRGDEVHLTVEKCAEVYFSPRIYCNVAIGE